MREDTEVDEILWGDLDSLIHFDNKKITLT